MDFIRLNWWRLLTRAFFSFLFFEIIFFITWKADGGHSPTGTTFELLVLYPGSIGLGFGVIAFYLGMLRFYSARRLYRDDSETSLHALFDGGAYDLVPRRIGWSIPTSEYLAGCVSSYPVMVYYTQDRSSKFKPRIDITAFVINQGRETLVQKNIPVSLTLRGKLKQSIAGDVSDFISSLKDAKLPPDPNPDYTRKKTIAKV